MFCVQIIGKIGKANRELLKPVVFSMQEKKITQHKQSSSTKLKKKIEGSCIRAFIVYLDMNDLPHVCRKSANPVLFRWNSFLLQIMHIDNEN